MANRSTVTLPTRLGFSAGIVLTTPPFPYSREQLKAPIGLPVMFEPELSDLERSHIHYCEVALENEGLVTAGGYGWAMVVTGVGASVAEACREASALAKRVVIPNVRYRSDIGEKLILGEYAYLQNLGIFSPP